MHKHVPILLLALLFLCILMAYKRIKHIWTNRTALYTLARIILSICITSDWIDLVQSNIGIYYYVIKKLMPNDFLRFI